MPGHQSIRKGPRIWKLMILVPILGLMTWAGLVGVARLRKPDARKLQFQNSQLTWHGMQVDVYSQHAARLSAMAQVTNDPDRIALYRNKATVARSIAAYHDAMAKVWIARIQEMPVIPAQPAPPANPYTFDRDHYDSDLRRFYPLQEPVVSLSEG